MDYEEFAVSIFLSRPTRVEGVGWKTTCPLIRLIQRAKVSVVALAASTFTTGSCLSISGAAMVTASAFQPFNTLFRNDRNHGKSSHGIRPPQVRDHTQR